MIIKKETIHCLCTCAKFNITSSISNQIMDAKTLQPQLLLLLATHKYRCFIKTQLYMTSPKANGTLIVFSFIHFQSFWGLILRLFKALLLRGAPSTVTLFSYLERECKLLNKAFLDKL